MATRKHKNQCLPKVRIAVQLYYKHAALWTVHLDSFYEIIKLLSLKKNKLVINIP